MKKLLFPIFILAFGFCLFLVVNHDKIKAQSIGDGITAKEEPTDTKIIEEPPPEEKPAELKLVEITKSVSISGKVLTATQYRAKKLELVDKLEASEPVEIKEFSDILQTEIDLCGGIKVQNYEGDGSDIVEKFLAEGCFK